MGSDPLLLQWQDFKEDIRASYNTFRNQQDFADVTLACDDGVQIEAHKVILTVGSSVFRNTLQINKHPHPLIFLRGIKYDTLLSVLDFIYYGEVELRDEKLKDFLAAAEDLNLRGIKSKSEMEEKPTFTNQLQCSNTKLNKPLSKEGITILPNKRENPELQRTGQDDTILENIASTELMNETQDTSKYFVIKGIEENNTPHSHISTELNLDTANLEETGSESLLLDDEDIQYECTTCGKVLKSKSLLSAHAQRHLPGFSTTPHDNICPKCEKAFESKSYMYKHMSMHHKKIKLLSTTNNNICPKCEKAFESKSRMYKHMSMRHIKNIKFETKMRFKNLDAEIKPFISRVGLGIWMCKACGKKGKKTHTSTHVESRHMDLSLPCTECGHITKNRDALRAHCTKYCKFQSFE